MKKGRIGQNTALIVASALVFSTAAYATDPPPGLLAKIAARETENSQALANYTYRQSVMIEEFNAQGMVSGGYREIRDIIFSPAGERYEKAVEPVTNTLTRIRLTPEDFSDIRDVDPFLLTTDKLWLFQGQYKGEETVDGVLCFVEYIQPKEIIGSQRFFEGLLWVRESDFAVIRSEGQSVPQIETLKEQNLTPHFTTERQEVDGKWMFPKETHADDTLFFRDWPQRVRIAIKYQNYKHFGTESTLSFGDESQPASPGPR